MKIAKRKISKIFSEALKTLDTEQIKTILDIYNNKEYLKIKAIELIKSSNTLNKHENDLLWAIIILAICQYE
jgi:hypothetical protein